MSDNFNRDAPIGKTLIQWWSGLEDDRASRAILRRAASPTKVALCAPYQRLYRQMHSLGWNRDDKTHLQDRFAAAVGLLAHVQQDVPGLTPPKSMSQREPGNDRLAVSELRFLRLLDTQDIDMLYDGLRRTLPLMERKVDVIALSNDVLFWGEKVRKSWAYAYAWPIRTKEKE